MFINYRRELELEVHIDRQKIPRQTLHYRKRKLARNGNQDQPADLLFNTYTVGTSNLSQQELSGPRHSTESDNSDTDPQSFDEEQPSLVGTRRTRRGRVPGTH